MDLAAWYRSHGESVFRRCRRLSNSDEQARDLMQEVFLRAHKYKKTYKGGSPLSWLLTIADRTAYDALRKMKQKPKSAIDVSELKAFETISHTQRRETVRQLLHSTDQRTALIVIRRYFDEMTYDDIALELSLNEKTVRRSLDKFFKHARAFSEKTNATFESGGSHA